VKRYLAEAESLGVKEYYFTGGEPFMNPEIHPILEGALGQGPVSVLTNGLLIRRDSAARLRSLSDATEYSLDLRVSIDGFDAATNDPIRGAGTFARILQGIRHLVEAGVHPVITVSEACEGAGTQDGRRRFLALLAEIGLPHPRLKILPLLLIGAEEQRSRGYQECETLEGTSLTPDDLSDLQCSSCRMVTRGVWVADFLDAPDARIERRLARH
jgi:sulfatase maturation enzyme AslB (radical SAM superfamily)